jgi:ABC-type multidrug transport system fused ATPase/permease subunit
MSHGDNKVFDGLNFHVAPGEVVAIVGPTGIGKSTLADILIGLQNADAGTLSIGGVDTTHLNNEHRAGAVAVAFQEAFLFADSIHENVALGRSVGLDEVWWALTMAGADQFVRDLPEGINTIVGERGVSLSGGQRQRVALARALVGRPRVVFLDDSTSAVDPAVEAKILDNLRGNELEVTLLVVAHRLSTIKLADRVIFLADGKVGGTGSHIELMADPRYERLARAYEDEGVVQ